MTTIDRFEQTVRDYKKKVAIIDNKGKHTFSELRSRAIQIGTAVESRLNGKTNRPVVICLDEGFEYVAAMLGVLYSGNFYVPLIKEMPIVQIGQILNTIDPSLIITDMSKTKLFLRNGISVSSLLLMEEIETNDEADSTVSGYKKVIDTDPVYIVHTSGSTGEPKGVIISHRALYDHLLQLNRRFDINSEVIISCKHHFNYDAIVPEIYPMIFFGSQVIIRKNENKKTSEERLREIVHELNTYKVNTLFYTTPLFKLIANEDGFKDRKPLYLKRVQFGGEVVPVKLLNYWKRNLPDVEYSNVYGPTETTDVCSYYIADEELSEENLLPAGKAFDNRDIIIVNEAGETIQTGEAGEVYIRGVSVGTGYWHKKEISKEAFVQNPLHSHYRDICYKTGDLATYDDDGKILFIGRKDSQIKYRGNRVELGEIEAAALAMPDIKDCCVLFNKAKNSYTVLHS